MTLLVLAWLAAFPHQALSGELRRDAEIPSRVLFVPADDSPVVAGCDLQGRRWVCATVAAGSRGLVVLIGLDSVAAFAAGADGQPVSRGAWGRVIQVSPGAVTSAELHDLDLSAWKPDRPRLRPHARQFMVTADEGVLVVRLSDHRFWVSGRLTDPDAFLLVEGPAIGSQRLPTARLPEEPVEQIVYVNAGAPTPLQGFVQGSRGEAADGAAVDLMELLEWSADPRLADDTPVIYRASTSASADGSFRFDRVTGGPFRVSTRHAQLGRAAVWTTSAAAPISIKLLPMPRVSGRVVRQRLPLAGARVRFVPDIATWTAAANPADLIALETTSEDDGAFVVGVPAARPGTIQILAADGAGVRVAVPVVRSGDLSIGDVAILDGPSLLIRVVDGEGCDLVAAGPLGSLGLVMVRSSTGAELYRLDLPERGTWALTAECSGQLVPVEPAVVAAPADSQEPLDLRVIRPPES